MNQPASRNRPWAFNRRCRIRPHLQMEIDMRTNESKPMRWTTPTEEAAWVALVLRADRDATRRATEAMPMTRQETQAAGGITRVPCGGGYRVLRVPARY